MSGTRLLQSLGWAVFTVLLIAIGIVFLDACDLNVRPLFGLRYCLSPASPPNLQPEQERERELRARIHEAELRLAQLPVCTAEDTGPAKPGVQPSDKDIMPAEKDTNAPEKDTKPPEKEAELKVPSRIEDLRGCWQSVRGDIDMRTDDRYLKLVGRVRLCFCFGSNGRGRALWHYTDGRICETDLTATIETDELHIAHGEAHCTDQWVIVPEQITCKGQPDGGAECERQGLGRMRRHRVGERYKRVNEEYCRRL
jgi:hypothetical protein